VNRWYRYPLAARVVRRLVPTSVTADQVTVAHALLGVAAAIVVLFGSRTALVVAGVLWEAHLFLDCLDGALARARGTESARGHTVDIIGDTVALLALAAAMWVHVRATAPATGAGRLVLAMIASEALAAWAHDFYRRTFAAALTTGTDLVAEELATKRRALAEDSGFVAWFGWVFTWLQVIGLAPGRVRELARAVRADRVATRPHPSSEVDAIVAAADRPSARRAFRAVGLMSNDNGVTILGVGLLLGHVKTAIVATTVYASVTFVVGLAVCGAFLRDAYRASAAG
jgi:phosphatidylglycerophosphate synthase